MDTRQCLAVSFLTVVAAASAAATEVVYAQTAAVINAPVKAMIMDFFALSITGGIAVVFWIVRREKKRRAEAILANAWNEVLNDPHYSERREIEERQRLSGQRATAEKPHGRHFKPRFLREHGVRAVHGQSFVRTLNNRHKAPLLFRIDNVLNRREPHRSATLPANGVKLAHRDPLSFRSSRKIRSVQEDKYN